MGGYGAEGTAAEATAMETNGVAYHLIGGDALALVFGVRQTRVGQVEGMVELLRGHGGIGWSHYDVLLSHLLDECLGVQLIALLLNMAEVFGLFLQVGKTVFVTVERNGILLRETGRLLIHRYGLRQLLLSEDGLAKGFPPDASLTFLVIRKGGVIGFDKRHEATGDFDAGHLPHAIDDAVGIGGDEYAGQELLLPIVVMGEAAHTGLYAAEYDGHVRIELTQNLGIYDSGIFWPHVVPPVRRIGILRAQAAGSGVFVHHRVHATRGNPKPKARSPQAAEVPEVAVPVGLWDNGHPKSFCLQNTPNDSRAKRGVVNVGVPRKEDDISTVPTAQLHLAAGRGQEGGQFVAHNAILLPFLRTWRGRAG